MKNNAYKNLAISILIFMATPMSWGEIFVVTEPEVPLNCASIGIFEGNAGYGKTLGGEKIALHKALDAASKAGASYAVVQEVNRGLSDQGGYSVVEGFICDDSLKQHL